jgi:hypothetical protein
MEEGVWGYPLLELCRVATTAVFSELCRAHVLVCAFAFPFLINLTPAFLGKRSPKGVLRRRALIHCRYAEPTL